jgi:hypothetical protein
MILFCIPHSEHEEFWNSIPIDCSVTRLGAFEDRLIYSIEVIELALHGKQLVQYSHFVHQFRKYITYSFKCDINPLKRTEILKFVHSQGLYVVKICSTISSVSFDISGFKSKADMLMFKLALPK